MNTEINTAHDDVAAAFAKAAEPASNVPSTPAAAAPAPATPAAPAGTPARGPDGRFSGTETPTGTPAATPTPETPPGAPATPAAAAPQTPEVVDPNVTKFDPAKPPSGWRQEAKAKWDTLPEDIRQEITRREEASYQGVSRLKQQLAPAEELYRVTEPHKQYFEHIQKAPAEYLSEVIQIEQTLTLGNPAQKMQILLDLGDQYGVPLRQVLDAAMGGQLEAVMQQSHGVHKTPAALPAEVAAELAESRQFRQQMLDTAADNELKAFEASDPNTIPFYDQVRDKMADLLEQGKVETYQEAYDLAVWLDPALRSKAQAQANGAAQLSGVHARQAAAASISTPAAAPIAAANTIPENESVEDTVRRAYAAAAKPGGV